MDAKLDFNHKMALAEFDIEMGRKEFIPFARKVNSWVISNDML